MSEDAMRILLVEDNPGDVRLLRAMMAEAGAARCQFTHADRLSTGRQCLTEGDIDVILLDLSLPDSQGLSTLVRMQADANGVPIVVLTGLEDEALGVNLVQAGAQDYLVKGQITGALLMRSLRYATERKRAEEKLSLYRQIIANSSDAIAIIDLQGYYLEQNSAHGKLLGFSDDGLRGKTPALHLGEEVFSGIAQELARKGHYRGEVTSRTKSGTLVGVELSAFAVRNAAGEPVCYVGIKRDITARKRAEEELRASETRIRMLLESTGEGMWGLDLEGRCTFINKAACGMLGYPPEEAIGKNMHALVHHTRPDGSPYPEEECLIYGAFRTGQGVHVETEVLWRRDGTAFPADYSSYPIIEEGVIKGAVVAFTDITERKRAERELVEIQVALRDNREALRALAAQLLTAQEEERRRVSRELHDDMNQKLAMLAVEVETLERHLPFSPDLIRQQLQSLGNRVAELSDDIRRLAYQLHPSILDHLGLAIALQSHVEDFAKRERIEVTFSQQDLPDSLPQDLATCLYRVTQESLRNIAKHARATQAAITLTSSDNGILLSIKDSGAGFNPDGGSDSRGGLGLISMKERVRLVNGSFLIQSHPGHGTQVVVWIPLPERAS